MQEHDILSVDGAAVEMKKSRKQEIIANHPYRIFEGKDGRWHTTFKDDTYEGGRRHIAKSSYEKLLDAIVDHYRTKEDDTYFKEITVERLYPKWLEHKKLHTNSDASIYRITTEWKKHYLGTDIITIPIIDLTRLQLDEWAHKLIKDNNMSKKQYYNTSMIMRQTLHYAVDLDIIPFSEFDKVNIDAGRMFRRIVKPASETQVFTIKEVDTMHDIAWDAFYSHRNSKHQLIPLAFMFFFQTGMRISEICSLRYEDLDDDEIHVQRMYSDYEHDVKDRTKGYYGDRYVPLTEDAVMLIDAARKRQCAEAVCSTGYIFSMTDDPVPYGELRKTFYKYCDKADIIHKSSHKSRKTVISTLIDDGVNINTIREMMGHVDDRTTYSSYCFDRKEKSARNKLISNSLSRSYG